MRKRLLITTLLLSIVLMACGKTETAATTEEPTTKENLVVEEKTEIKENNSSAPSGVNVETTYYGYIDLFENSTLGGEKMEFNEETGGDSFVMQATCDNLDTLNTFIGSILESDLGISIIGINDGTHYVNLFLNGEGQEPTVMWSDDGDSYQFADSPDWYNPTSDDEYIDYANMLYYNALDGVFIGIEEDE